MQETVWPLVCAKDFYCMSPDHCGLRAKLICTSIGGGKGG